MSAFQKFVTALLLIACLVASSVFAQEDDAAAQALRDVQIGMAGLKEASQNPALLAQMMRDLANPEIMAEAKKMMDNPEFQKQMADMRNSKEFKESIQKAQEAMKDPATAAKTEAKLEHMIKRGEDDLKRAAGGMMEDAMAAMSNPEVMAEMAKMVKDPNFKQQLQDMMKDPSFKSYTDAMQDMMKDPEKKKQMEMLGSAFRAQI